MDEPEFDADGYPTERTLRAIRRWKIEQPSDADALLAFVQRGWRWPYFTRSTTPLPEWEGAKPTWVWEVSTGGWSGHEDMIAAMERNHLFWMLTWHQSRRGGHYVFRSPSTEE